MSGKVTDELLAEPTWAPCCEWVRCSGHIVSKALHSNGGCLTHNVFSDVLAHRWSQLLCQHAALTLHELSLLE